jgi:hypothetical protein
VGRSGIHELCTLLDEAFRGAGIEETNESQALLPNLATVPPDQWRAVAPGGVRTVADIAGHIGACLVMYDDYAFGTGSLRFGTPEVEPYAESGSPEEVRAWLEAVHERFVEHVRALPDDLELDRLRPTNWGEERPTRWIVAAMVTHHAYHAGEINHLRSILGTDDRWRYIQLGFG